MTRRQFYWRQFPEPFSKQWREKRKNINIFIYTYPHMPYCVMWLNYWFSAVCVTVCYIMMFSLAWVIYCDVCIYDWSKYCTYLIFVLLVEFKSNNIFISTYTFFFNLYLMLPMKHNSKTQFKLVANNNNETTM